MPSHINRGEFKWSKEDLRPVLKDIELNIKKGELTAVVGKVGSGKSSLISALLGDTVKMDGDVILRGSVAYVPQQPWVMNATLRENIVFGHRWDPVFYEKVLEVCSLKTDIAILSGGDQTEIGERGINLSGGQKARVSLARAIYARADIYLLDDPLSAVDAHVGRHIFDHVIGPEGILKNKARLLVTHGIAFLSQTDQVVMLRHGEIELMGSYNDLMQQKSELYNLMNEFGRQAVSTSSEETMEEETLEDFATADLTQNEEYALLNRQRSNSDTSDMSGLTLRRASLASLKKSSQIKKVGNERLMTVEESAKGSVSNDVYKEYAKSCSFYGVIAVLILLALSQMSSIGTNLWLKHWSSENQNTDEVLPRTFSSYFSVLFVVISTVVVIGVSTPAFILMLVPLSFIYLYTQRYYLSTSRELKRLDSVGKSPIYSHFQETISGVSTIRAYEQQQRFTFENENRLDDNQRAYYPSISCNRWLAVRLEFMGSIIILSASLFAVLDIVYGGSNIDAGLVGLSVSYALSVTQELNWVIRQYCEIETNIVSVERVKEYIDLPTEKYDAPGNVSPMWPEEGKIEFKEYATRYRPGLDLVLRNLTFSVQAKEKIGIVGRTGAGKSSLSLSLFRIVEAAKGSITIDGVDISHLCLFDLRSRLTIIPQDPVLFAGTVRDNLDPFGTSDDAQLWRALEQSHLHQHISSLDNKLNAVVLEGGENFSVGQRQLICLARALLRRTTILILDEATAAIC
ncbi:hypothetical protein G6F56_007556 [Rhizopus delemar]|nr:hypothetical protein G6F56_007556 [Rhizopus delemar]